jgi:hypothetical protein
MTSLSPPPFLANETDQRNSLYCKINVAFHPLENKGNCWVVAGTFLTPQLNIDQSDHTRPSLKHHGLTFVDRFGYDAANNGKMSRHRGWSPATDMDWEE